MTNVRFALGRRHSFRRPGIKQRNLGRQRSEVCRPQLPGFDFRRSVELDVLFDNEENCRFYWQNSAFVRGTVASGAALPVEREKRARPSRALLGSTGRVNPEVALSETDPGILTVNFQDARILGIPGATTNPTAKRSHSSRPSRASPRRLNQTLDDLRHLR